jgi:hypothetical protein
MGLRSRRRHARADEFSSGVGGERRIGKGRPRPVSFKSPRGIIEPRLFFVVSRVLPARSWFSSWQCTAVGCPSRRQVAQWMSADSPQARFEISERRAGSELSEALTGRCA